MAQDNVQTATAVLKALRGSPRKTNLVLAMIRGMHVKNAMEALRYCEKRSSNAVLKTLMSAMANAENNFGFDIDKLYVREASVGKAFVMKRFRARARGRAGKILKPFSRIRIELAEFEV